MSAHAQGGLTIERPALEQLAALLLEKAGLKITPDGYYGLRMAMQSRMPALGLSDAQDYVRRLRQLAGEHELRALLPLVTVGKTEFFRDQRQFRALEKELIPLLLKLGRREQRPVRIWSAGCATGEEPYSLAMVCDEAGALPGEVEILATDLNPLAVESAQKGLFPVRRLVGVSEERLSRYFAFSDDGYHVAPSVRSFIRFEAHNLAAPVWSGTWHQSLDLILCRNVIIYFDQPTIRGLMQRFLDAMRPGGVLLLGYSESLFKLYSRFEMFEVEGTFAYRRPQPGSAAPVVLPAHREPPRPPHLPLPAPRPLSPSGRFPAASAVPPPPRPSAPPPPPSAPPPNPSLAAPREHTQRIAAVAALMEAGDFPRALLVARQAALAQPDELAALLTLGNVQALMGSADAALESFNAALAKEPLCVEARVYLALLHLQLRRYDEARAELTRALFLEPTLALGHYLLAQVNELKGDHEAARRGFRNALQQRKTAPRPLLGHYPELPESNEAIAQASQYRLAALSES